MNETDARRRWQRRYQEQAGEPFQVCTVLKENKQLLPAAGTALDLACGRGGNALFLARHGLQVTACDFSEEALRQLRTEATRQSLRLAYRACTATELLSQEQQWEVITVSHFLERENTARLMAALLPGGLLYYQTFSTDREHKGPRNPNYLLRPNELLRLFAPLELLYYREERKVGVGARHLPGKACLVGRHRPEKPREKTGSH